jgi:hypothetical protein
MTSLRPSTASELRLDARVEQATVDRDIAEEDV